MVKVDPKWMTHSSVECMQSRVNKMFIDHGQKLRQSALVWAPTLFLFEKMSEEANLFPNQGRRLLTLLDRLTEENLTQSVFVEIAEDLVKEGPFDSKLISVALSLSHQKLQLVLETEVFVNPMESIMSLMKRASVTAMATALGNAAQFDRKDSVNMIDYGQNYQRVRNQLEQVVGGLPAYVHITPERKPNTPRSVDRVRRRVCAALSLDVERIQKTRTHEKVSMALNELNKLPGESNTIKKAKLY